jgi:hypothetical protein
MGRDHQWPVHGVPGLGGKGVGVGEEGGQFPERAHVGIAQQGVAVVVVEAVAQAATVKGQQGEEEQEVGD